MFSFQDLWDNHPTITGNDQPCSTNGKPNFSNQCAIRLGVALSACGIDTRKLPGVRHCWHHDKAKGHVLSAEELARGLKAFPVAGLGMFQQIEASEFSEKLRGRKGIIFLRIIGKEPSMENKKALEIEPETILIYGIAQE